MPLKSDKTYNPFNILNANKNTKFKKFTNGIKEYSLYANNKTELSQGITGNINSSKYLYPYPVSTNFIKEGIELNNGIEKDTIKLNEYTKIQPKKYIGGSTVDSRKTFLNRYPAYSNKVDSIESIYGLPKNILKTTLAVEGVLDDYIYENNNMADPYNIPYSNKKYNKESIDELINNPNEVNLVDYGYDIANEKGEFNKVSKYLKKNIPPPKLQEFENEKYENRRSGFYRGSDSLDNALNLKSAKLLQIKESVINDAKKHNIQMNDEKLSYWINAYWNSGEYDAKNTMIKNKGNYVSPTYNGKVTLGSNGKKFLEQYRAFLNNK